MRRVLMSLALLGGLVLSACEKEEVAAPAAAPKSLGRPDQMYAGEDLLESISAGSVERGHGPGVLVLKATATAPTAGYTRPYFLPYIYPAKPADGIYEVQVVATKPATPGPAAPAELKIEGAWNKYTDDRVKGVKFVTKTNSLVAMVPPAKAAP